MTRHDCSAGEIGGDVDVVEQLQSSLCSLIDRESTRAVATIRNSLLQLEDELLVDIAEDVSELSVCLEKDTAVDSKAGAVVVLFVAKLLVEAVESNLELPVEIVEDVSELSVYLEKDTAVDSKAGAVVVADGTVCRNQFNVDWTITAACRN